MSECTQCGVVVGVDGSAVGNLAIAWAARDAVRRDVQLTLVNVQSPADASLPLCDAYHQSPDERGRRLLDAAERVVGRAIEGMGPITLARKVLIGAPVPTLVNLSKNATLVVVGRNGTTSLHRRFVGSVTSGLMRQARSPVAVVPADDLGPGSDMRPILLGINGPPATDAAIGIAFDEATRRGVDVIALHAWADTEATRFARFERERQIVVGEAALGERLARWRRRHPEVCVENRLVFGEPTRALVEASGSAQLTVVGSHGRGRLGSMLLGSVSSVVVQGARTPVIVARR
jgi:nucleotide-binding universal stress UspA family protein